MKPAYRITVNGDNITPKIQGRLISLNLTDERRNKADQLDITLDDSDGKLAIPPQGAKVKLWLGFDKDLVYKGSFTVDETEHTGTPDQLTIRARSASFKKTLDQKREQSYIFTTLGDILRTIAKRNKLDPAIHPKLNGHFVAHLDQTNESDASFITRLAQLHDAVSNIKADRLLFSPAGEKTSATGSQLKPATISRQQGDTHTYTAKTKGSDYTGVTAHWNNTNTGQQESSTAGKTDKVKVLRHTHASKAEADIAAAAELRKLKRSGRTLQLNLAVADPTLFPELPANVQGYKAEIDKTDWVIERVTHSANDSGYTMGVELESS